MYMQSMFWRPSASRWGYELKYFFSGATYKCKKPKLREKREWDHFLHQMSLMPRRYEGQRESWQYLSGMGMRWDLKRLQTHFLPSKALACAALFLRNNPVARLHHHPPSFSPACFAWLMSLWYFYLSLRITKVVDPCHISNSASLSSFPCFPLLFCNAGMGGRALPEVSVWGQQCSPGPGAGKHSSPTATAAYLLSTSPAGQRWWWQPPEAAHQTHPTGREYTENFLLSLCLCRRIIDFWVNEDFFSSNSIQHE